MDANQNATLFGSVMLPVKLNTGEDATARIRQLAIREYPMALAALGDEIAFAGLCTSFAAAPPASGPATRVADLDQSSYELVQEKVREVNAGFFKYAARQVERAAENLRNLPAEMRQKILSSVPSATLPPTAG